MTLRCVLCRAEIDPQTVPDPPPEPLYCLDCIESRDGEVLIKVKGEAQDIIPDDERDL